MNPEISSNTRPVDRLARAKALDPLADAMQVIVRRVIGEGGPLAPFSDLLHGKPLGHSLHAVVTDVPVGAWTTAAVFDACELAGRAEFARASDVAIAFGMLAGTLAIASGYAEWSDTAGEPKRLGAAHAAMNAIGFTAYGASLVARATGRRPLGIALAFAGYAASSLSAYVGGELSTGMQIGIRHTTVPVFPPERFTTVLAADELRDGETKRVEFGGIAALVTRSGDDVRAVAAVCTHRGAPLDVGDVVDGCIVCPWHGARYSTLDGRVGRGPATFPLARFEARIVEDAIQLRALAA